MTVVREQQRVFAAPCDLVVAAMRRVLGEGRAYELVEEDPHGTFEVVYRPRIPLVLSTPIAIKAESLGDATAVTVRTRSQSLILGDVFNFYDRYIQAFFDSLRGQIQDTQQANASDAASPRR